MRADCIAAVNQAVGRELTAAELRGIEERIGRHMHMAAAENPAGWRSMSPAERLQTAAAGAHGEFMAEQAKKAQRVAQQVIADTRNVDAINEIVATGKSVTTALVNRLEQVGAYVKGVRNEFFSGLMDSIAAAEPRFFGMVENPVAVRDFVLEVLGQKSGNEIAARGAKAWLETTETMRQRFNAAGGNVGKLQYGYLPQPHESIAVLNAGRAAWVEKIIPLLDRKRYTNPDGTRMNDAQLSEFLGKAWDTISSDGLNKVEPGQFRGNGMLANHGAESRQIHFKDADSYLAYMQEFGRGTVFSSMQGHVSMLARDIALVEEMGPNPSHLFTKLNDMAIREDGGVKHTGPLFVTAKNVWDELSGYTSQTVHQRLGDVSQGIRNYTTAAKLQGTLLSSFSDVPTMMMTANFNNLPLWDLFRNTIQAFGRESREFANTHGLVADSIISDMNRFAEGNYGHGWTSKLANATMKLGLMNAWQDALRRGYSVTQMAAFGKLSRTEWGKLNKADRAHMQAKGITEADWQVLRKATPEQWRGQDMLTPEAVKAIPDAALEGISGSSREIALAKMLGFIADEAEYAVVGPDLMARASVSRGTQKGTVEGEFRRHLALFTTFPRAMVSRHLRRAYEMDGGMGSAGYAASLALGLTLFGALSIQAKDLVSGKDPRDMTQPKFWAGAFFQGGGAGIYGDILYTGMGGNDRNGAPNWTRLAGPVFGTGFDLANVTAGNLGELMSGKKTNAPGEIIRFARGNMPFVNLWYAKSALDHMIFHEAMEYASPGYLSNLRARARRDFQQGFWWEPGGGAPDRSPNLMASVGGR